ncbi:MAG: lipoprotein releasing system, transrane protein LolC/E family [Acidobacteria bacterium]|nr:lipoprotein releasing system, transrane protein LolC/E family [Acidobacteriota bacterium]
MSFELKLAFKYYRSKRKSPAGFTAAAAIVGIAAGVASLIIAQALAKGFSDEMRDKILANTAHVSISATDGSDIFNWLEIKNELLKNGNITQVIPTALESAVLLSANGTSYAILRAENHEPEKENQNKTETWNYELKTVSIGAELAEKSKLKPGDEAELITIEADDTTRHTPVRVEDVFRTGLYEYDSTWIYISPENYASLRGQRNFVPAALNVSVADIYKSDVYAEQIRSAVGEKYRVIDWQEANRPLFAALSLERKVALAIISLIIFIAALNITTTLALLVGERRLDIAVLRTCGAKTGSLIAIFLLEGLFLAFSGIALGVVSGVLACFAGNYFKIVSIPAEVYSLRYIPLHTSAANILLIVIIAFFVCLLATVYPAFRASRVKPLENLRNR